MKQSGVELGYIIGGGRLHYRFSNVSPVRPSDNELHNPSLNADMPRKLMVKKWTDLDDQEIVSRFKETENPKDRERLLAISMALVGRYSLKSIGTKVNRDPSTIQRWIGQYRNGGLDALLHRKRPNGRPPKISQEVARELATGIAEDRWESPKTVQRWLLSEHQIELALPTVYYWIEKLGNESILTS